MKRRTFLALSSVAALYLAARYMRSGGGMGMMSGGGMMGGGSSSLPPGGIKIKDLPIPALLKPVERNGVQHYDLQIQRAEHDFFKDMMTKTFAINGTYLGPTLLMKNGDHVSVNYQNRLGELITMHGHGMHLPSRMDGTVHQPIQDGENWSAVYTVKQKACTNWYHPHTLNNTAEQVYKGLAGLIIIEDEESRRLDLPKRYGIDDIPLVLQDRLFAHGQIDYSPSMPQRMHGYVGDIPLANGAIEPTLDIEAKEIRFRILNGSNASIYELGFSDGRSFHQIATDNAFLEYPVKITEVTLSPAERAEIVIDLTKDYGRSLVLRDRRSGKQFLTIRVTKMATAQTLLPQKLTRLEKPLVSQAHYRRRFVLSGMMGRFTINGKGMDPDRIDEHVPLNRLEIWEVENNMMIDHNFHIHATHFIPIARNGSIENLAENEKGYKDVILVPANETVSFLVKMTDYADVRIPYMYHCHFLEHEDAGMMGQFIVS